MLMLGFFPWKLVDLTPPGFLRWDDKKVPENSQVLLDNPHDVGYDNEVK